MRVKLRREEYSSLGISRLLIYSSLMVALITISREVSLVYPLVATLFIPLALFMDERGWYPLSNRFITAITLILIPVLLYGIHLEVIFERFSRVIMLLIVAKLLATKQLRDYLQIALFSLMLMAAAAVGQWGISFALLLTTHSSLLLLGLIFLYSSTEVERLSRRGVSILALWGALMTLVLLPASLLFFFLLPRPSVGFIPGWAGGKTIVRTGFGETVSPGTVENIKRDPSVAFRVEFLNRESPLPSRLLYWRGRVYGGYNRGKWFALRSQNNSPRLSLLSGEILRYRVFLEPYEGNALFTLGVPVRATSKMGRILRKGGYTLALAHPVERRISYRVVSQMVEAIPQDIPPEEFLKVPQKVREALQSLSESLGRDEENPMVVAKEIELYLRKHNRYSLHPESEGVYPVVDFLLNHKPGHCEYFASGMAILLRLKGIPSRLVAGFLGGIWNPVGNYYIVKNSDAHTWVEAWIPWLGWVPFDPTPPSSAGAMERPNKLQRILDYLRFQWYHWIINYDYQKQVGLFRKGFSLLTGGGKKPHLKERMPDKKTLIRILAGMVLATLMLLLILWWRDRPRTWGERLDRVLRKKRYQRAPGETLLEVAQKAKLENNEFSERLERVIRLYYRSEFGEDELAEKELKEAVKDVERL